MPSILKNYPQPPTGGGNGPQIDARHPDYLERITQWNKIDDCLAGEEKVKEGRTKYLPMPNATDQSPENIARYNAMICRAVFYNVTGRTRDNLVGQSFAVEPVYTGPDELRAVVDNVDGAGVTMIQQSKLALGHVVSKSRGVLLVDYPVTEGVVTRAQAEDEGVRAKILFFRPQQFINWRLREKGAHTILERAVLEELYDKEDDGFAITKEKQWRVLELSKEGVYSVKIYRKGDNGFTLHKELTPRKGDGMPFDFIPLKVIGAESNDVTVEKPGMLDIANLNIAHFRNSADYEEMTFLTGQATPWAAGLTDDWVRNHLKNRIELGSRALIPLPEGASVGLLQAQSGTLPKEAMDQKEAMMTALGAKLAEKREVKRTATEAGIDEASATSYLASCVNNVSEAYTEALRWAALFQAVEIPEVDEEGADASEVFGFELNTDFAVARMSPEDRNANREDYNADLITFEEARDNLKGGGVAWLDNEAAKDEIEERKEADFLRAQEQFELSKPPGTPPNSPPASE